MKGEKTGSLKHPGRASGYTVSPYIIRWIKETRGNKCELCGWDLKHPCSGEPPLQVHHIDGNGANNRPENLQLLCPNCHSLTKNWGNYK